MTFQEWWKQKGFDSPLGYEVAEAAWNAAKKEAIPIIRWLDDEVKGGADDYEVERFLNDM